MAILTLEQYKTDMGINSPNKDAQLGPLIDMANAFIPRYCNSNFEPLVIEGALPTEVMDNVILMDTAPIVSVEQITLRGDEILLPEAFYLDTMEGIITILDRGVLIPSSRFDYSIDYTTGWPETPADIKSAAEELVKYYEKREFSKSKDLGNGQAITHQVTKTVPVQVRSILDLYRVM
jgi:hypothetical protein